MRERSKHRRERKAALRRHIRGIRRRQRRINAVVGKAAITAVLTLGAARHGSPDAHVRRSTSAIVQAANLPPLPDFRSAYRVPTPLLTPPTGLHRRSRNRRFDKHINEAAAKHGVDVDLVRAIIQVESGFDHRARSHRGAKGLMQLMPGTARDMGARNLFDPKQNIFAGVRYLRFLLDAFQGNVTLAAAAYNAGPTVVKRYGGVPPYQETQNYVEKVHSLLGGQPAGLALPRALSDALLLPDDLAPGAASIFSGIESAARGSR
jgi:soluble lytic murein transglycosylase-like protein